MKDLVKFKKDIQNLLIEKYNAYQIFQDDVRNIVEKNLKSFPTEKFFDYYIFNIKNMKYIIGFDSGYDMIIFYSNGFVEGFYQVSCFNLEFIKIEEIDLLEKRKEEFNRFINWFKKKYNLPESENKKQLNINLPLGFYPNKNDFVLKIGPDFIL